MYPIVVKKQPTFLESLLSAAGIGISQSMQRYYKERDRKRGVTQSILQSVLEGDVSPELLTTDLARSFTEQMGISREPAIRSLQQEGLEKFRPPAKKKELSPDGAVVDVPQAMPSEWIEKGVPYTEYRRGQEIAKEKEAQVEQARKLRYYTAQKRIDKVVEREFRMPLGERWEAAWSEYERAMKMGVPISGLVVRDPETGATITMDTHMAQLGREKSEKIARTKSGITYLKEELKYNSLLMDAEKFVSKLATAETMEPDEFESDFIKSEIGLWQQKELTPQQIRIMARRRLPILNQKIEAQHRILRKQRFLAKDPDITLPFLKEFKLNEILNPERYAGEFETIKAYTDLIKKSDREAIRNTEVKEAKLREALNRADMRDVVIPPESPREPMGEAINAFATRIIDERWIDGDTNQLYTKEKAREVAERLLKKK